MSKGPCPPDCAERSATCHGGCEKYQAFVVKQQASYARRRQEYEVNAAVMDGQDRMRRLRGLTRVKG